MSYADQLLQLLGELSGPINHFAARLGHSNIVTPVVSLVLGFVVVVKILGWMFSGLPKDLRTLENSLKDVSKVYQDYRQRVGLFFRQTDDETFSVQVAQWLANESQSVGRRRRAALKKLAKTIVANAENYVRKGFGQSQFPKPKAEQMPFADPSGVQLRALFRVLANYNDSVVDRDTLALHVLNLSKKGWFKRAFNFRPSKAKIANAIVQLISKEAEIELNDRTFQVFAKLNKVMNANSVPSLPPTTDANEVFEVAPSGEPNVVTGPLAAHHRPGYGQPVGNGNGRIS